MEFSKLFFEPTTALKIPPLPVSFIEVAFSDDPDIKLEDALSTCAPLPLGLTPLFRAELVSGRRLTGGEDVKETLELSLSIESYSQEVSFKPGNSVGIFPQNPADEVNELLKRLGLEERSDTPIKITVKYGVKKKLPLYIPKVSTPRVLLESVLEIRSVTKKAFLRALAEYTADTEEKRRLLEFCSREGSSEYDKYFLQQGLTLSDVLTSMSSCVPPLSLLLEHLPRLTPRPYSIASSCKSNEKVFKIVFNIVVTPRGRLGVCSSWLKNKFEEKDDLSKTFERMGVSECVGGDNSSKNVPVIIPLFFREPSFCITYPIGGTLILVAHGTGIAPILGLIEGYAEERGPPVRVYYGCRYRGRDEIYKNEMNDYLKRKFISEYGVSYSRDRQTSEPKYVQDLLYADKETICDLIVNKLAFVYICGDAKNMVKDVRTVLVQILEECSGTTSDKAEEIICRMEESKWIIKDVWR